MALEKYLLSVSTVILSNDEQNENETKEKQYL